MAKDKPVAPAVAVADSAAPAAPAAAPEATTPTAPPVTPPAPPAAPEMVKARVLVDGAFGVANSVVEVPATEAEASPELDPHPEAVAYAESLAAPAEPAAE